MSKSHFSWCNPIFTFAVIILLFLSSFRMLLILWQWGRVEQVRGLMFIIIQGIRFDLILLGFALVIPLLLVPIFSASHKIRRFIQPMLRGYLLAVGGVIIVSELITPNFIIQYDFRPNNLAFDYLIYPKEVFTMLVKAVPVQLFLTFVLSIISLVLLNRRLKRVEKKVGESFLWSAPFLSILGLILCILTARSTFGHRPINPSDAAFSSDPLINTLSLSSAYSMLYSFYEKQAHENNGKPPYGALPDEAVYQSIKNTMYISDNMFTDPQIPTLHIQNNPTPTVSNKTKNIVIILEESLGADFVGSLGGNDLTPELDKLAKTGIWFENLYATGTRSVRGIEAVITGFLPTTSPSVVKLGGSQHNFFTFADLLKVKNYKTSFIYGGEARFDNMKRFFANNGFDTIVEEKDYIDPQFKGSWGVSDEDLFAKANDIFERHTQEGETFFSLVFTSSNHSPFDFPDGRIENITSEKNTVENAVKYSDYALGKFIEKAKLSSYWKDTLFLIVADHSDRVYGEELVPYQKYHIPGLILGENIEPKSLTRITSQIDLMPTLFSMAGLKGEHPSIGIDLTRTDLEKIPGRAIMQFHENQAYMEEDKIIFMQKGKKALQYAFIDNKLQAKELEESFYNKALSHSIWPFLAYQNKNYRLNKEDNLSETH